MTKRKLKIQEKLSAAAGRRDEQMNIALAEEISASADAAAVQELISVLEDGSAALRSDAIKALYETGNRSPELIAEHWKFFLQLLYDSNNRIVWGAMCALDSIATVKADELSKKLPVIVDAAASGSVITRDHAVGLLVQLGSLPKYRKKAVPILLDLLSKSPGNQFPTYAERIAPLTEGSEKLTLAKMVRNRMDEYGNSAKGRRLHKVLSSLQS